MNSQWIGPVSRKIVIALAFAAAASAASAAAVATPGDPFPAGSIVNLSPSFSSAFGTISLAFGDFDLVGHTGSLFNYNAELIATVSGTTYDLPGQFEVTVAGLANPVVDGHITVALNSGTFRVDDRDRCDRGHGKHQFAYQRHIDLHRVRRQSGGQHLGHLEP